MAGGGYNLWSLTPPAFFSNKRDLPCYKARLFTCYGGFISDFLLAAPFKVFNLKTLPFRDSTPSIFAVSTTHSK